MGSPILPFTESGRLAGARLCEFGTGSSRLLNAHTDWITKYLQNGALRDELGCATNALELSANPSLQFDVVAGNSYAIEVAGVGQALAASVPVLVEALPTVAI